MAWPIEDFELYPAHLFPDFAEICDKYVPRVLCIIRGRRFSIYIVTPEALKETLAFLLEVDA
ncbi:MAG: hypothetical protein RTU92_10915 [Candidatus Thorarchaeota archaeon]